MFGEGPIYLALRPDALLLTVGEGALEAMTELATAKPGPAPVAQVDLRVRRLAVALATQRDDPSGDIEKAAAESLKDGDTIHAIVEGGKPLKVRLTMKAAVLKFLVVLGRRRSKTSDGQADVGRIEIRPTSPRQIPPNKSCLHPEFTIPRPVAHATI
jgi:hypothetical protein